MAGIIGTNVVAQVGFIVKDIEVTKRKWAEFLGVDVPETRPIGDYAVTQMKYMGEPSPEADCLMAFFDCGPGFQIELIQPNDKPSTWRAFLEEHGEGIHHLGFNVKGSAECLASAEAAGLKLVQQGTYGDASGEYHYLDAPELKCVVEMLERYAR